MSFGTTADAPAATKSLGNINADQLTSSQQIIPVTYLAGRRYVAGQFLSPCYNQINKAVTSQTGKSSSGTTGYIYFADFAILFGMGGRQPFDGVWKVIQDAEIIWQNDSGLMRDTPDYSAITIANFGTLYLYWGKPTQAIDSFVFGTRGAVPVDPDFDPRNKSTWPANYVPGASDPLAGHYDRHPAYKNQCYAVFKKWQLGQSRTQVPQLMLELSRGVPWFTGVSVDRAAMGLDSDARGVNPIGVLYDWLTDDITGLGLPDAALNQSGFADALTYFADYRISVALTAQDNVRSQITKLLEYIDAFPRDLNGLFDVGWWSHGPIDLGTLPTVYDDDLDDEPSLKPTSYADVNTKFFVNYSDREHHYNPRPQQFSNPNAKRVLGEERTVVVNREWITDATLAKQFVTEYGNTMSRPGQSGDFPMKRERVDDLALREGQRFIWDSARSGLQIVLRIQEIEFPEDKSGTAKLTVESERSIWPTLYIPPPDTSLGDFLVEAVEVTQARIVELPSGINSIVTNLIPVNNGNPVASGAVPVIVLAQRPRLEATGFNVYVSPDGSTYDLSSPDAHFAAYGKVASADYPAATALLDTTTGITVDLYGADLDSVVAQSDAARDNDTLLLFVGNEIMSVGQVTALGSGRYNIQVQRSRFGTAMATHAIDADCYFILRGQMVPTLHSAMQPGATVYFKLQPFTAGSQVDIAGVSPFLHTFATKVPFAVTGLEILDQANDEIFVGRDLPLAWRLTSTLVPVMGPFEIDPGSYDATFQEYRIRFRDLTSGEVLATYTSAVPLFTLSYEQNALMPGGPRRDILAGVAALDIYGNLSPWLEREFNNPAPGKITPEIGLIGDTVHIILSPSADLDWKGFRVWRSTAADFTPSDDSLVYDGPDTHIVIPHTPGVALYYIVAAYDSFGVVGLNYSGPTLIFQERGNIEDLPVPSIAPGQTNFDTSLDLNVASAAGGVFYTLDNTPVTTSSAQWPTILTIPVTLGTITITQSCTLRVRAFIIPNSPPAPDEDPFIHQSPELQIPYMRNDVVVVGGGGPSTGARCANVAIGRPHSGTPGRSAITVPLACATPLSTIHYQIDGGGYSTYSPGTYVSIDLDSILEAYASATGFSDGPVSTLNNASSGPPL